MNYYITKTGANLLNEANQKINLSNLIYLPLPKARPVGKNPANLQQGNTNKSQNNAGHIQRMYDYIKRIAAIETVNRKMGRDVDESRKQRKAARKRQQTWVSTTRNRESTPFLAQVHQALSTGVGPKDKKTGKVQDLSQWQGHATQQGKQGTGTIDVIGDPVHRRAALQSGRSSRHCVGTACQELVDQFAKDRLSDKTKTQAKKDERELHGAIPDAAATKTSLEINSPDTPRGAKGTRVSKEREVSEGIRDWFRRKKKPSEPIKLPKKSSAADRGQGRKENPHTGKSTTGEPSLEDQTTDIDNTRANRRNIDDIFGESKESLDASRPDFKKFLLDLGHRRRVRNIRRSTLLPTSSKAIASSIKGKDTPLAKRLNVAKNTGKLR